MGSTATRSSYTRHRQRAAARRRRALLLLVMAVALCVTGIALLYPRVRGGEEPLPMPIQPTATVAPAQTEEPAATTAPAEAAATDGGDIIARYQSGPIQPDDQPSPQAQAAIDEAMANGRPPQFIVSSFDGAADIDMYRLWLPLAEETGARFTFFVSGIYLLLPQHADAYQPPNKPTGFSNLGGYSELAGSQGALRNLYDNYLAFDAARRMGNEIGTHYVSHICEESNAWTADDWVSEQTQWERLMLNVNEVNQLKKPIDSIITKSDFHGGRTPCLMGDKTALYSAMAQMGYVYDASQEGILGQWPEKQQGLWNFPLPSIHRYGSKYATLAMDYNFYFNHGKVDAPARLKTLENWTYRSYYGAFRELYRSNRAPLILGSHFATWNHGVYNRALARTLRRACTTPEVACVDFVTLARWLDRQPPGKLAAWQAGTFPRS